MIAANVLIYVALDAVDMRNPSMHWRYACASSAMTLNAALFGCPTTLAGLADWRKRHVDDVARFLMDGAARLLAAQHPT